ncbi:hypothetical protein C4573_06610 [Candidatus Woesearchaeota archaeon]|nr:MAG: hypothetical protein C4573_06610 [Candidatus Woesearchaeota archaeon]
MKIWVPLTLGILACASPVFSQDKPEEKPIEKKTITRTVTSTIETAARFQFGRVYMDGDVLAKNAIIADATYKSTSTPTIVTEGAQEPTTGKKLLTSFHGSFTYNPALSQIGSVHIEGKVGTNRIFDELFFGAKFQTYSVEPQFQGDKDKSASVRLTAQASWKDITAVVEKDFNPGSTVYIQRKTSTPHMFNQENLEGTLTGLLGYTNASPIKGQEFFYGDIGLQVSKPIHGFNAGVGVNYFFGPEHHAYGNFSVSRTF